jgi:hypothetical protein
MKLLFKRFIKIIKPTKIHLSKEKRMFFVAKLKGKKTHNSLVSPFLRPSMNLNLALHLTNAGLSQ